MESEPDDSIDIVPFPDRPATPGRATSSDRALVLDFPETAPIERISKGLWPLFSFGQGAKGVSWLECWPELNTSAS